MGKYDKFKLEENQKPAKALHIFNKDKFSHTKELSVQKQVFNVYQLNILNNLIFLNKVKNETIPVVYLPKFQKPAHPCSTNFSKLNYIKPTSQLSRSKYRISARRPTLWNEFLKDREKKIGNLSPFKNKVRSKLLSYENYGSPKVPLVWCKIFLIWCNNFDVSCKIFLIW